MNPTHSSDQFQFQNHSKNGLSSAGKLENSHGGHIHSLNDAPVIKDVWEDNFYEEFSTIISLLDKYKVVAMDTEFPGIVYKLTEVDLSSLPSYQEIEYRTIKMNVDKLKVIQVGISFANETGHIPSGVSTWQFNLKFDIDSDESSKESIQLLSHSGIQFDKHKSKGINPQLFAEYLISSGLALNEDVKWVTFHGGFDFAYLIKILHGQALPDDETGFYNLLGAYFPSFFDVKCMIRDIDSMKTGGLNKLASDLNVKRIGPQHQAGSDSLLTLSTYFKLKETYLKGVPEYKHANVLYGIGSMGDEDYIWQNYVVSDYPYSVLNSYGMNSIPMMNHSYYPQSENVYSGMVNANYNLNFPVVYNNFGSNPYVEPNPKPKKYDTSMRKLKNQV